MDSQINVSFIGPMAFIPVETQMFSWLSKNLHAASLPTGTLLTMNESLRGVESPAIVSGVFETGSLKSRPRT